MSIALENQKRSDIDKERERHEKEMAQLDINKIEAERALKEATERLDIERKLSEAKVDAIAASHDSHIRILAEDDKDDDDDNVNDDVFSLDTDGLQLAGKAIGDRTRKWANMHNTFAVNQSVVPSPTPSASRLQPEATQSVIPPPHDDKHLPVAKRLDYKDAIQSLRTKMDSKKSATPPPLPPRSVKPTPPPLPPSIPPRKDEGPTEADYAAADAADAERLEIRIAMEKELIDLKYKKEREAVTANPPLQKVVSGLSSDVFRENTKLQREKDVLAEEMAAWKAKAETLERERQTSDQNPNTLQHVIKELQELKLKAETLGGGIGDRRRPEAEPENRPPPVNPPPMTPSVEPPENPANLIQARTFAYQHLKETRPTTKFSGANNVDYRFHKKLLESNLDIPAVSDRQKVQELHHYFEGAALALIEHCIMDDDASRGYSDAIRSLDRKFLKTETALEMLRDALKGGPIQERDTNGLLLFYSKLLSKHRLAVNFGRAHEFDAEFVIQEVLKKVPHLAKKWVSKVVKVSVRGGKELGFTDFLSYLDEQHSEADRMRAYYNHSNQASGPKNHKVSMIGNRRSGQPADERVETPEADVNSTTAVDNGCLACTRHHPLDKCEDFAKMDPETMKLTLSRSRGCFRCGDTTHMARRCPARLTCETCNGRHATFLHPIQSIRTALPFNERPPPPPQ